MEKLSLGIIRQRILRITQAYFEDRLTDHDIPAWIRLIGQARENLNNPTHYRLMARFLGILYGNDANDLKGYCDRKLTSIRSGKDKGKTVYQPKVLRKRPGTESSDYFLPMERLEKQTTKKGKIRSVRVSSRYLTGVSQLHTQNRHNDDAPDAYQLAVSDYLESVWNPYVIESDQLGYSPLRKVGNLVVPNCKPFSYGFLALACAKTARQSQQWKKRVSSILDYRLKRDLPLTEEKPAEIVSPLHDLKEQRNSLIQSIKSNPAVSRLASRVARLILWGTPQQKVADQLDLSLTRVEQLWAMVKTKYPEIKPMKTKRDRKPATV